MTTLSPDPVETETLANSRVSNEVRSWLGRTQRTQRDLAGYLGISPTSLTFRMKGKTPWSITELMKVASWFEISLAQLLGEDLVNEKNPHPMGEGSQGRNTDQGVARARFELATSGL